jgi:AmmeMemoRadiSam system protein B
MEAIGKSYLREPAVAGAFYPGNERALSSQVDDLLSKASDVPMKGRPTALISPHAGYVYSGGVAAWAYRQLKGKRFDAVVLIGPCHRAFMWESSVYSKGGFKTPLGVVEIDTALAEEIMSKTSKIVFEPRAHQGEHSLEVQLPFLQRTIKDFKIVPIVMGAQSKGYCDELSRAVAEAVRGKSVLLIASTDLSHYHPYDVAVKLDEILIRSVEAYDPERLSEDLEAGRCEACGGGPTVATLMASRALGADGVKVLKYANSGDVSGDKSRVVGYMSGVVYKEEG